MWLTSSCSPNIFAACILEDLIIWIIWHNYGRYMNSWSYIVFTGENRNNFATKMKYVPKNTVEMPSVWRKRDSTLYLTFDIQCEQHYFHMCSSAMWEYLCNTFSIISRAETSFSFHVFIDGIESIASYFCLNVWFDLNRCWWVSMTRAHFTCA